MAFDFFILGCLSAAFCSGRIFVKAIASGSGDWLWCSRYFGHHCPSRFLFLPFSYIKDWGPPEPLISFSMYPIELRLLVYPIEHHDYLDISHSDANCSNSFQALARQIAWSVRKFSGWPRLNKKLQGVSGLEFLLNAVDTYSHHTKCMVLFLPEVEWPFIQ